MVGTWHFITVLILTFALFTLIAGIFTAYFGAGKSRKIGGVLIIIALIVGLFYTLPPIREVTGVVVGVDISSIIIDAVIILVAAIIGAVCALALFLGAIMKS
ncbi:MAG: hypothetical protein JSV56_11215 [Methanomassiliicoccales archaeon]|jgi:hypothetical protein|nr:MAG: hypothetical protein JSV56_11215 [Methanomassiliicoccales archaeon]